MPDYVDWFVNREKQFQGFLKMLARETPKWSAVGYAYYRFGRFDEAVAAWERAGP